ncbi:MAG: LytR C-terminal domain-containing protein, partial [Candidatus Corynebacterium faecigallinarum]
DGSGANIDRGETAVTVLNNGPSNGGPIATDAADRLREDNWSNIGFGNLQGRVTGVSEETRVYYPEGNAQAQAAAEQIGRDLGIPVASGNNDYYDRFGEADVRNGPDATNVVIVLTGPLT